MATPTIVDQVDIDDDSGADALITVDLGSLTGVQNDDMLLVAMGGDKAASTFPDDLTPPASPAYASGDWQWLAGGLHSSTAQSFMYYCKVTTAGSVVDDDFGVGGDRPHVGQAFLIRGVDWTKMGNHPTTLVAWFNNANSKPSWAEASDLNSGGGINYDDNLVISITAEDDGTWDTASLPTLTPGSWTTEYHGANDHSAGAWAAVGSLAVASSGTIAKQDIESTNISDACTTVAIPGAAGDTVVTPGAIALSTVHPAASAVGAANVSPGVIALSTVHPAPSIAAAAAVTPDELGLVTAHPAVTISAESVVTPGAIALATGHPQASPAAGAAVTPGVLALATGHPTPTITTAPVVTPGVLALSTGHPAPSIAAGANVTPAAIGLATAHPQASASAESAVTPATIGLVTVHPQASPLGAAATTPATIVLATGHPQATPATGAVVTPTPLGLATAHPQASPSAGAAVTPAELALATGHPQPSLLAGAAVTPAALVPVLALPTPTIDVPGSGTPVFGACVTEISSTTFTGPAVSGSDTLGLVSVANATAQNPTGVTWGGSGMTRVTTDTSQRLHIFKIDNPSSSASIVISGISGPDQEVYSACYLSDAGDVVQSKEGTNAGGGEYTVTLDSATTAAFGLLMFSASYGPGAHNNGHSSWEVNGSATGVVEDFDVGDTGAGDDLRSAMGYDADGATGGADSMSVTVNNADNEEGVVLEISGIPTGPTVVTPATLGLATAHPQASPAAGAAVAPATLVLATGHPTPTIDVGAIVTPAVIALATAHPQATPFAPAIVTPTTIALATGHPQATPMVAAVVTPSTLGLSVVMATPVIFIGDLAVAVLPPWLATLTTGGPTTAVIAVGAGGVTSAPLDTRGTSQADPSDSGKSHAAI